MLRATVVSLLLALALLGTASAAHAADTLAARSTSSYTVSIDGVQVSTSSKSSTQLWYGVSAIGGGWERTYAADVPAGGGFVPFGGTRQYPDGYCITWVMYTTFTGFYGTPLCTAPAADSAAVTPEVEQSPAATTAPTEVAAAPTEPAAPSTAPATASAKAAPSAAPSPAAARATAAASATVSATAAPSATPTATAAPTPTPTASTAAPVDVELPEDTTLVDTSGTQMRDSFSAMSERASQDTATAAHGDSPVGYVVGGAAGLVAAAAGGGMLLLRLGRRG